MNYAKKLGINNFRGVFMRDTLPKTPNIIECGIINLGDSTTEGSHWSCFFKNKMDKTYFDSYGDANPPKELVSYLGGSRLFYNEDRIQDYNDPPICGHLCLVVLYLLVNEQIPFNSILQKLKKDKYFWDSWF